MDERGILVPPESDWKACGHGVKEMVDMADAVDQLGVAVRAKCWNNDLERKTGVSQAVISFDVDEESLSTELQEWRREIDAKRNESIAN